MWCSSVGVLIFGEGRFVGLGGGGGFGGGMGALTNHMPRSPICILAERLLVMAAMR